jgi:hypothetical protein
VGRVRVRWVQVRAIAATVGLSALALANAVVGATGEFYWPVDRVAPLLLTPLCGGAAVAVAAGRWWARFYALSVALFFVLRPFGNGQPYGEAWTFLVGLALLACLLGRAMLLSFEGRAPAPMVWTGPRVGVVRWAIVTNAAAVLGDVMAQLHVARGAAVPGVVLDRLILGALIALGGVLLVGLLLLARQRTIGLFVAAFAVTCMTVILVILAAPEWLHAHHATEHGMEIDYAPTLEAMVMVMTPPGLVMAWAAVVVWSRPIIRFLRGSSA